MASLANESLTPRQHACIICARRKVKCDKGSPCSNCQKSNAKCSYESNALPRPRKRAVDDELLAKLARYEDLMRQNNIDFSEATNVWVLSHLEDRLKSSGSASGTSPSTPSTPSKQTAYSQLATPENSMQHLWNSLPLELKNPPNRIFAFKTDPDIRPLSPCEFFHPPQKPLHELHPEPRHIFRYWQIFVETVNPLIKIVHVPTLQQRIMDASWDLATAPPSLHAIMFAIYTLSAISLTPGACSETFGEERGAIIDRYRTTTAHALGVADFLQTRDLEVLQAFGLFLFADPESELTSTLTGVAIRIGLKMGMHCDKTEEGLSFFDKEMRIRLWWQLNGINSRSLALYVSNARPPPPTEFGDIRLPLNVNDADLHPDMADPPIEHSGPTEMIFVLTKFQVYNWLRSSKSALHMFDRVMNNHDKTTATSWAMEDAAISELENQYYGKVLQNIDPSIPLHRMAQGLGHLALSRLRFKVYRPRLRGPTDRWTQMAPEKDDMVFDAAIDTLDLVHLGTRNKFSAHLFDHMISRSQICKSQMTAYIYLLCGLKKKNSGGRVACIWKLIENLYGQHPELIEEKENPFFAAFGDLALDAWQASNGQLSRGPDVPAQDNAPPFVMSLQRNRQTDHTGGITEVTAFSDPTAHGLGDLALDAMDDFDWTSWNEFIRM